MTHPQSWRTFRDRAVAIVLGCALGPSLAWAAVPPASQPRTYIEFLWSPTPAGALARQETLGFVMEGGEGPQVCVAVLDKVAVGSLRIEAIDAEGRRVSDRRHDDFHGEKRCYAADLPGDAAPGAWTFRAYLDDRPVPAGERRIEVARDLESAAFHRPSLTPYVLGRPNYDAAIPPDQWTGRLVWAMRVDALGRVTGVEVEIAEGVGALLRERAIAAGYLSRFPPDPARAADAVYRRELSLRPD